MPFLESGKQESEVKYAEPHLDDATWEELIDTLNDIKGPDRGYYLTHAFGDAFLAPRSHNEDPDVKFPRAKEILDMMGDGYPQYKNALGGYMENDPKYANDEAKKIEGRDLQLEAQNELSDLVASKDKREQDYAKTCADYIKQQNEIFTQAEKDPSVLETRITVPGVKSPNDLGFVKDGETRNKPSDQDFNKEQDKLRKKAVSIIS